MVGDGDSSVPSDQCMAQQRLEAARGTAEQAALAAFPALRDQNSEFSRRVKAALQQRHAEGVSSPYEAYDVANNVAREMNVEAARAVTPGNFTASGFQPAPVTAAPKPNRLELTDADIERIGSRLAEALPADRLPDGRTKRRTFDKKRVKERSKMYADNADLYRHTKLGSE